MSTQTPTPDRPTPAPSAAATDQAAVPATVTVVHRRASDIVCGDVIALPDEVFFPVTGRDGNHRTFAWQPRPFRLRRNPHRWRLVCEVDHLDEEPNDEGPDGAVSGITASLPFGFRVLRVSDDHPDQGQQYQSQIIALREHDLIAVQQRTPQNPAPDPQGGPGRAAEAPPDHPHTTGMQLRDYRVRDGVVRVFDRNPHSDDASDMYVLEVFGISVLVRLRNTRTHPADRPQVFLHVDNEAREPSSLAVEVANGGETHYRI
jgi:hypothetical protein